MLRNRGGTDEESVEGLLFAQVLDDSCSLHHLQQANQEIAAAAADGQLQHLSLQ